MTGAEQGPVVDLPPVPGGLLPERLEPSSSEGRPKCLVGPIEDEPAGSCMYGDGWADPAIVVGWSGGGTGPGWTRYAHPECAERAAAGGALDVDVAIVMGTRLRVWGADR